MLADKHIGGSTEHDPQPIKRDTYRATDGRPRLHTYLWGIISPGEPDVDARARCYEFAKLAACRIENDPRNQKVWFVKDA